MGSREMKTRKEKKKEVAVVGGGVYCCDFNTEG